MVFSSLERQQQICQITSCFVVPWYSVIEKLWHYPQSLSGTDVGLQNITISILTGNIFLLTNGMMLRVCEFLS